MVLKTPTHSGDLMRIIPDLLGETLNARNARNDIFQAHKISAKMIIFSKVIFLSPQRNKNHLGWRSYGLYYCDKIP